MQMLFRNDIVNNVLEKEAQESHRLRAEVDLKLSIITEDTLRHKKSAYISKKSNSITSDNKKEIADMLSNFDEAHKGFEDKIKREQLLQEERFLNEKAKRSKRSSSRNVSSHRESTDGDTRLAPTKFLADLTSDLSPPSPVTAQMKQKAEERRKLIPLAPQKKDLPPGTPPKRQESPSFNT